MHVAGCQIREDAKKSYGLEVNLCKFPSRELELGSLSSLGGLGRQEELKVSNELLGV